MDLRQKFSLLTLLYVLSLVVNLILTTWCIVVYFDSAVYGAQLGAFQQQQIERTLQLLRQQREVLESDREAGELGAESKEIQRQLGVAMAPILAQLDQQSTRGLRKSIDEAVQRKNAVVGEWLARRVGGETGEPLAAEDEQVFADLESWLLRASGIFGEQRASGVDAAADTQQTVVAILLGNALAGIVICVLGAFYVRRWIMEPIADLRKATKQISQGNFSHRVQPRSSDELGQLAEEVNQMASTIVTMQNQLVEQERLAAAGEMVTRLAHNIRNPLAGIRGLSEATIALHPSDEDLLACQQRIIDTVDRFEKWLRDLQQSVSPMKLNPQKVHLPSLLDGVLAALRPMFDRRGVRYEVSVEPAVQEVQVDCLHFEQALVALVTNAVQASESGQLVRVLAQRHPREKGLWRLSVVDQGAGISPELMKKIFMPYFTTKPDGNGLGLAMAHKVVRLHGGQLAVESEPGRGSRFNADLPGPATE